MCYISTGLGLNFCFPLLKWADSCYSKQDDIWRPGTKFCRTYDSIEQILNLSLSLSLSLSVRARVTCMCICICMIAPPAPLFFGVSAIDGKCLHYTHASWKVPSIMPPCLKTCLCGLETLS